MGKRYLIYIACGNAAASSSLVRARLDDLLHADRVDTDMEVMRISEMASRVVQRKPDLVIITAGVASKQGLPDDVPLLSGLPLMTMVGVSDFVRKVKEALHVVG
jgi:galactitol-specific phosphotransferase system IIB component